MSATTKSKKTPPKTIQDFESTMYQKLINEIDLGVAIYEYKQGKFLFKKINKQASKIEGIKEKEVLGKDVADVFPGVKNKEFGLHEVFQKVYKTGKAIHLPEKKYEYKDKVFWRDNSVYKLSNEQIASVFKDVTDRVKKRKEVEEKNRKIQAIIENMNDALFLHTFEGKIIEVNQQAVHYLGYTKKELESADLSLFDDPKYAKNSPAKIKEIIKKGALVFEGVHLSKEGKKIPVSISSVLVSKKEEGLIQSIVRNISEYKEFEEKIEKIHNMTNFGSWEYDISKEIYTWSDQVYQICGSKPQKFVPTKKKHLEFVHLDDRPKVLAAIQKAIKQKTGYNIKKRIVREDGEIRYVHSIAEVELDNKGNAVRIVGAFHDITKQKRAEIELEEKIEEKEKLNRIMVERELKMIELKEENKRLKKKINDLRGL